jgi:hypothetical protein
MLSAGDLPSATGNNTAPEPFSAQGAMNTAEQQIAAMAHHPTAAHHIGDTGDDQPEHELFESRTDPHQAVDPAALASSTEADRFEGGRTDERPYYPEPRTDGGPIAAPYYEEVQGAFPASRVYDPNTPQQPVTDDDFKRNTSGDWPELSFSELENPIKKKGMSPVLVLAIVLGAMLIGIGAIGVGMRWQQGGDEDAPIWGDIEAEKRAEEERSKDDGTKADETKADETKADETKADEAKADETNADDAKADDTKADETNADDAKADDTKADEASEGAAEAPPEAAEASLPAIDPKWKKRRVAFRVKKATGDRRSESLKLPGLLQRAFTQEVLRDDHARWQARRRVKRGHEVFLRIVEVDEVGGSRGKRVRAQCSYASFLRPGRKKVEGSADVIVEAGRGSAISENAADACARALAKDFVHRALQ